MAKKKAHKCGVRCKNYKKYGKCDRKTFKKRCWQHTKRKKPVFHRVRAR